MSDVGLTQEMLDRVTQIKAEPAPTLSRAEVEAIRNTKHGWPVSALCNTALALWDRDKKRTLEIAAQRRRHKTVLRALTEELNDKCQIELEADMKIRALTEDRENRGG